MCIYIYIYIYTSVDLSALAGGEGDGQAELAGGYRVTCYSTLYLSQYYLMLYSITDRVRLGGASWRTHLTILLAYLTRWRTCFITKLGWAKNTCRCFLIVCFSREETHGDAWTIRARCPRDKYKTYASAIVPHAVHYTNQVYAYITASLYVYVYVCI